MIADAWTSGAVVLAVALVALVVVLLEELRRR